MSTSRQTVILSEVAKRQPSARTQAYFQSRAMSAYYTFLVEKFLEQEKAGTLTRAELARRTHKDAAVITRLLSRPSNMTLATLSDLLLAIGGEEPVPQSAPIPTVAPTQFPTWAYDSATASQPKQDRRESPLGQLPPPNAQPKSLEYSNANS